jgi:hypothetical protein
MEEARRKMQMKHNKEAEEAAAKKKEVGNMCCSTQTFEQYLTNIQEKLDGPWFLRCSGWLVHLKFTVTMHVHACTYILL